MTQQTTDKLGFTQVWEGSPSDFIQIIDKWASVPRNLLKTDNGTESGFITLWVANEWIDWCYYRAKNEYIPLGDQVWRVEDSEAIRRKLKDRGRGSLSPVVKAALEKGANYARKQRQQDEKAYTDLKNFPRLH